MTRILVVSNSLQSFVQQDIDLLSQRYEVEWLQYQSKKDLWKLFRAVRRSDAVLCWFVMSYANHALRFGRPVVLVAGGFDLSAEPGYGGLIGKRAEKSIKAMQKADEVVAVSKYLAERVRTVSGRKPTLIYNAVDTERFVPDGKPKEKRILTVASFLSIGRYRAKGIRFLRVVSQYVKGMDPEVEFILVGSHGALSLSYGAIDVVGYVSDEEILRYYQDCPVYFQPSWMEEFGLATAEAMACGATPVVTNVGGLPEVVGDVGFVVPHGAVRETAEALVQALWEGRDVVINREARERVVDLFSAERRRDALVNVLEGVMT